MIMCCVFEKKLHLRSNKIFENRMKNRGLTVGHIGITLKVFACVAAVLLLCNGCDNFINRDPFDKTLMSGYWIDGTVHEYYDPSGTGYTWDTADDVSEEEAQPFTWKLEKKTLTQYHQMEMGGTIPKTYTVTKLSATMLQYHDDYGKYYYFTKER